MKTQRSEQNEENRVKKIAAYFLPLRYYDLKMILHEAVEDELSYRTKNVMEIDYLFKHKTTLKFG